MGSNVAIFLDRDGVINQDLNYVSCSDDFHFIDGVIDALLMMKQKGYLLVLVTNQSGIARGYFTEQQFLSLTEWMDWNLADRGIDLNGIYYCPHHPDAAIAEYRAQCDCRKPAPGMLLDAAKSLKLDLAKCWLVGDKESDLDAGIAAGLSQRILVRTGKIVTESAQNKATAVYDDLLDFAKTLPQHI